MRLSPFALADRLLIRPGDRQRAKDLLPVPFAHRGLHGAGRVENSRSAFEAAIARGHGIELDVQASADAEALVFHDHDLGRLTGKPGAVGERSAAELTQIKLSGSDDRIPSLAEVLHLIDGRVPLLIEVKAPHRRVAPLCAAVLRALSGYQGAVGIMSFNPEVGHWFAANAPLARRGLVVTEAGRRWRGALARRLAYWRARPDFLAYDIRDLPSSFAQRARRSGVPIFTWTCRSDAEMSRAKVHADQIIYEDPQ